MSLFMQSWRVVVIFVRKSRQSWRWALLLVWYPN